MNVSDIIDSTQTAVAHYEYAPFGETVYSSGALSLANPYRFSSEYADDTLGLVYYNYRHYNPLIGRWTSRDPIEEDGGLNIYKHISSGADILGLKIVWAVRDLADWFVSMGNHHFIAFIYENKSDAPHQLVGALEPITCESSGCKYYIYTVGILRASDGSIKYYTNNQDDIAAIKEYYCKEKKWWDSGYQEHAIKGFNERELADMILLGVEHYNENCSIETPQYDVFSRNCATWVNCLLKFVGIGDSKREELGEFFGIDWGEESDDLYYYFFKWLP